MNETQSNDLIEPRLLTSSQTPARKTKNIRIAIVINFLTSYREGFYQKLLAAEGIDVTIYCHTPPPNLNLTSIHERFIEHVCLMKGRFFLREKVIISDLPWRDLLSSFDVVYVEGNPRYLSLALLATLLRLKGRRVVLWTMIHSFRNYRLGLELRLAWYKLFSQILVYSDVEAKFLYSEGNEAQIVSINNGVDYKLISKAAQEWTPSRLNTWRESNGLSNRPIILSCSRLEQKNKLTQVLLAIPQIVKHHNELIWCVIGDGPERSALEAQTQQLGLTSHVRFLGQIYDVNEQAPWFLSSQLLVHPGAIGLTLLHAMAFGLPVITHNDAKHHGPEFAAMDNGKNGLTHREDSVEEMRDRLLELLKNSDRCQELGRAGKDAVKCKYNTDVMVKQFLMMIDRQAHMGQANAT